MQSESSGRASSGPLALFALSWRSPQTTERALRSWSRLDRALVGERSIWYQGISDSDRQQAARYGFTALGSSDNVGLGEAYRQCLDRCSTEYATFLECDWVLTGHHPERHLRDALGLIAGGSVDVMRLRSRRRPGWPLNTVIARGRERDHPSWLLESAYWTLRPDKRFPGEIRRIFTSKEHWYLARSANAAWTNNPHMARSEFLRSVAERSGRKGAELEPEVNSWWGDSDLTVGQGRGLFTHERVDGPSELSTLRRKFVLNLKRTLPTGAYQALRRERHSA